MEFSHKNTQKILLWSLAAALLPMLVFPSRFGTELSSTSLNSILFELVYYGTVLFFLNRSTSLAHLIQGAGVCFVYRLVIGAVFGIASSLFYSMSFSVSMSLGLSSYLPGVIFHAAVTPFILMPILRDQSVPARKPVSSNPEPKVKASTDSNISSGTTTIAFSKNMDNSAPRSKAVSPRSASESRAVSGGFSSNESISTGNLSGFEKAIRYLAEHGAIQLAAVVDAEGLLLAGYSRSAAVAEDWAPFALIFYNNNRIVTERVNWPKLEKIDLLLSDQRVLVGKTEQSYLMAVAERNNDEVLNIRFNQALEMIEKYVAERYSEKLFAKPEKEICMTS